ncbi:MAG: HD domain-containing protein [Demequinaceae bacterium]|nr:HD domain-containing protein [Demequinaceae bacterium]
MSPTTGSHRSRSAEVPHPQGVGGLGQERLALAEELTARGVAGADRRAAMSELVLKRLEEHWTSVGGPESGAALGAVGSLARLTIGPASDLDLVIIHDGETLSDDEIAALAQKLWYPIWDAKIPLDHSVRSLAQCRDVASRDPIAASGLLDLRHVAGDAALIEKARTAILADWRVTARKHLPELLAGARTRAERFGELAYLIEPNLKESRGGIRDYTNLAALTATWLADRPHGAVDEAAEHLKDVRDALQVVTGGPQVVLGRHVAEKVAARMGYRSPDDLLSSLADTGRRIAYALDVTERKASRVLAGPERGHRIFLARHRRVPPTHTAVAPGLIEIGPDLALASDARPEDDALLPLRVGAYAAKTGLNPTPRLLEALPKTPGLPDPWPAEALELFLNLLRSSDRLFEAWEALDLNGVIVRWIPEWEGIRNRPQRSPVHIFTVDRHSIETVIQAGPLASTVENPDLLLLAALFHDIGKRPGAGDHSEAGAALIPTIAARMGLAPSFAEDLETLVRHHLLLAELASSQDPAAPETVAALLEPLEYRPALFDTLRALTEADAIAAGPKTWKPWRQALIDTLTRSARARLASRNPASR